MERILSSYASGDEDEDSTSNRVGKLPLPLHIVNGGLDLWVDQPEHHDNRVRSFRHFQGNYPSAVYIRSVFHHDVAYQGLTVIPKENRHISLTKTFTLRKHEIQPFLSAIGSSIRGVRQFQAAFQNYAVFINEERTRTFLALLVSNPKCIENIIKRIDCCMERFGLPVYYNPAIVHSTFAWINGDQYETLQHFINCQSFCSTPISLDVCEIIAKIGDKEYQFQLESC